MSLICPACGNTVAYGWDCYTDQYWARCNHDECSEYEKVKTCIDRRDYEDKTERYVDKKSGSSE
jgi:hypothetical protein